MYMPSPRMIGNGCAHLNQSSNQPLYGSPYPLATDVELPKHMQQIVSQYAHFQPGLVGLKSLTTRFVAAQGVLNPSVLSMRKGKISEGDIWFSRLLYCVE